MNTPRRSTRALVLALLALGAVALSACTPEEQALFQQVFQARQAKLVQLASIEPDGPSDAMLARLRWCESRGNYKAIGGGGSFRGAYQFMQSTWNVIARRVLPQYVGVDPAAAMPEVQDAMARALWAQEGPGHWPVCSRR